jgi:hypothetical protein
MSQFKNILLAAPILWLTLVSCGKKHRTETIEFTHTDSLTDIYLVLQDSLLLTWNTMIQDDNQKIKAMNHIVHELQVTGDINPEEARALSNRIDQLLRIRYTPKTLWNNDLIEEYDFASESLVNELISKAESIKSFAYNTTLQALVENIRSADLRVENYRIEYDALATRFNQFVEENKEQLSEVGDKDAIAKKPLFQMASE